MVFPSKMLLVPAFVLWFTVASFAFAAVYGHFDGLLHLKGSLTTSGVEVEMTVDRRQGKTVASP